ncbi:MAG: hypothetical protein QOJ39_1636 [Candidatus Eremiobacteraeota bacterium]|jgi:hypothetical protein|nr:hypothetical protein [Candidatus Eremiobacteraeota bacterium]
MLEYPGVDALLQDMTAATAEADTRWSTRFLWTANA